MTNNEANQLTVKHPFRKDDPTCESHVATSEHVVVTANEYAEQGNATTEWHRCLQQTVLFKEDLMDHEANQEHAADQHWGPGRRSLPGIRCLVKHAVSPELRVGL